MQRQYHEKPISAYKCLPKPALKYSNTEFLCNVCRKVENCMNCLAPAYCSLIYLASVGRLVGSGRARPLVVLRWTVCVKWLSVSTNTLWLGCRFAKLKQTDGREGCTSGVLMHKAVPASRRMFHYEMWTLWKSAESKHFWKLKGHQHDTDDPTALDDTQLVDAVFANWFVYMPPFGNVQSQGHHALNIMLMNIKLCMRSTHTNEKWTLCKLIPFGSTANSVMDTCFFAIRNMRSSV